MGVRVRVLLVNTQVLVVQVLWGLLRAHVRTLNVVLVTTWTAMAIPVLLAPVISAAVAATPLLVMPKLALALLAGTPVLAPPVPVQGTVTTKNVVPMLPPVTRLLALVPVVTPATGLRAH